MGNGKAVCGLIIEQNTIYIRQLLPYHTSRIPFFQLVLQSILWCVEERTRKKKV